MNGAPGRAPAPAGATGKLTVTVTYLQMKAWPGPAAVRGPVCDAPAASALLRLEAPTVSFYRYLYDTVGGPWLWYERRALSDEALRQAITAPGVELHVLFVRNVPAGFAELDRRRPAEVELAYFGLVPEFIGRGLGPGFLAQVLEHAWCPAGAAPPGRVWLHTCTLDHPKALPTYRRAGFEIYDRCTIVIADPRRPAAPD